MAELILTDEEKALPISQLSNETLGMLTKKPMFSFEKSLDDDDKIAWYIKIGLITWASKCADMNADHASSTIWGATDQGKNIGNWRLTLDRLDDAERTPDDNGQGRSLKMSIAADDLTPGHRLSTAWSLILSGLTALFCGRMSIAVAKNWKVKNMTVRNAAV